MKILVLDNYDSFTYNLVHLVREAGHEQVDVARNDKISIEEVGAYDKIILSPGPGVPAEAGILVPLVRRHAARKSILGVCLGHQAIAEAFGGRLANLEDVYHGVATPVHVVAPHYLFDGMPDTFEAGRYHSWIVDTLPPELLATAVDDECRVMAARHRQFDVHGVQFHPESVLTPRGREIIANFLGGGASRV
jgi:anthranilate synthase component 2